MVPYASDPMVARRAALIGLSALGGPPEVRSDDLDSFTGSFFGTVRRFRWPTFYRR
jgi:hypothetical protein